MSLYVIGIGPGHPALITPQATKALEASQYIIGYQAYIEQIRPGYAKHTLLEYALGEECQRVEKSIELAKLGHSVSLICSGDAGIYAMASLVFETLAKGDISLEVEVIPGISALQAIAAKSGAPLGHDFAVISLSDLLTPWPIIEKRVYAALTADFVLVLYNPRSKKRLLPFAQTLDLCLKHRTPQTPVVIGRELYRPHEQVHILRLDELKTEMVDMLSTVVIGNSQSSVWRNHMYTPRGYRVK